MPIYNPPGSSGLKFYTVTPGLYSSTAAYGLSGTHNITFDYSGLALTAFAGLLPAMIGVRITLVTTAGQSPSAGLSQLELDAGPLIGGSQSISDALEQTFYTPLAAPANGPPLTYTLMALTGIGFTTFNSLNTGPMPYGATLQFNTQTNVLGYYLDPTLPSLYQENLTGFWA